MNNQEMTDYIVGKSNVKGGKYQITQLQARYVLQQFRGAVLATLVKGGSVALAGLGKVEVKKAKARTIVNIKTGLPLLIPARKLADFKLSKLAKLAIR